MDFMDLTCDLELAIQLKDLGVEQDSLFYWYHSIFEGQQLLLDEEVEKKIKSNKLREDEYHITSAFTLNELNQILPEEIEEDNIIYYLQGYFSMFGRRRQYQIGYCAEDGRALTYIVEFNEIRAWAKLLIGILKSGYYKPIKRKANE